MSSSSPEAKNNPIRLRFHWWWILLLVLLTGFALFGDKGVLRLVKTYHHRSDLQAQVEALVAENQRLKQAIENLQHDHATIERIARQELGMVRKDEIVYQFPSMKNPARTEAESADESGRQ